MKIIITSKSITVAKRVRIAEAEFEHGGWVSAAEEALNDAKGYTGDERRFLIVDRYMGGGYAQPFGLHMVHFGRYDADAVAYRYDEEMRMEVKRT